MRAARGVAANVRGGLTLTEALEAVNAAMLGGGVVSYPRLIRAASSGEIPAERDGARWVIRRRDVGAIAAHFSRVDAGRAMRRASRGGA
jgi:hypothetical protein